MEGDFRALDNESLLAICEHLDGKSLASFGLLNTETAEAVRADPPWRLAYEREFPAQFRVLQKGPPPPSWRVAYSARQRAERCWAAGGLSIPTDLYQYHVKGRVLGVDFLGAPLPHDSIIGGLTHEGLQHADLVVWDRSGQQDTSAVGHALSLKGAESTTGPGMPFGILNLAHRPDTSQVVVTSLESAVHVVTVHPPSVSNSTEESDRDASGVEAMDSEGPGGGTGTDTESGAVGWTYEHAYELGGHQAACSQILCRRDMAVTASFDGGTRLFRLPPPGTTGNAAPAILPPLRVYSDDPAHGIAPHPAEDSRGVCAADLSADATRLATGGNDFQVKLWDAESGRISLRLTGCEGWVWWLEGLDPQLDQLVSASTDSCVRTWDCRAGRQIGAVALSQGPGAVFPAVSARPRADGLYLVAGTFDGKVNVIDRRMLRVLGSAAAHGDRVARVALRGDTALSCAFDGTVAAWDFAAAV